MEAILNSRSITSMSDFLSLTPGHFLIGSPLTSYLEPSLEKLPIARLLRWQCVEQIRHHFWRRWSQKYLHHCQQRNKRTIKTNPICIGQTVLLREDTASLLFWPVKY